MRALFKITPSATPASSGEAGFSLPEVLVSAIVMVLIAIGTLTTLSATGRAGSEERNRTQATGIAQEDQTRLRTIGVAQLGTLNETRTVVESGRSYTVNSKGQFQTDPGSTESCTEDTNYADFIKVSSTVTWSSIGTRPPVVLESIVAPPNGSLAEDRGSLAISVINALGVGIPNITVTGTGASTFSGVTGPNGCVVFSSIPVGTYSVNAAATGKVDKDGNAPQPRTTSVVGQSTNTVVFQYDQPGSVRVAQYQTRLTAGGALTATGITNDNLVVYNSAMAAPKVFGTTGTFATSHTVTPIFPFTSPVSVYPGTCDGNMPPALTPELTPPRIATATVTPGATTNIPAIQMPAVHLTVWSGTSSSSPGTTVGSARIRISDKGCLTNGVPLRRTFNAVASGTSRGRLNRALPWGVYDICAESATTPKRAITITNQNVKDYTNGLTLNLYTGSGVTGTCA